MAETIDTAAWKRALLAELDFRARQAAQAFSVDHRNIELKSIFFGGQKVLDNYCILISGIMDGDEKTINWEIIKKI